MRGNKLIILIGIYFIIGFLLGFFLKILPFNLFVLLALILLISSIIVGLIRKEIKYAKWPELSSEGKRNSVIALVIFMVTMTSAYFISDLLWK